jgi:acyl carrier protein
MHPLLSDVQEVFRRVFGDDQLAITETTAASDIEGWDSLAHLNLVIALEKQFGIKFATAEISRLRADNSNVGTLIGLLNRKVG